MGPTRAPDRSGSCQDRWMQRLDPGPRAEPGATRAAASPRAPQGGGAECARAAPSASEGTRKPKGLLKRRRGQREHAVGTTRIDDGWRVTVGPPSPPPLALQFAGRKVNPNGHGPPAQPPMARPNRPGGAVRNPSQPLRAVLATQARDRHCHGTRSPQYVIIAATAARAAPPQWASAVRGPATCRSNGRTADATGTALAPAAGCDACPPPH
jgi:hypothetical protein